MRISLSSLLIVIAIPLLFSCHGGANGSDTFCDTTCFGDTIQFIGTHEKKPTVSISMVNCLPDSIIWSYEGMGTNRKTGFTYLIGSTTRINKKFVQVKFKDVDYAWVLFNDCYTGRGFQIKLPYEKSANFSLKSSGINDIDPKFDVAENLIVNTDRGNIFIEDAYTGKKAMMTFGQKLDIDYDAIHEYIDSVHVTNDRVWIRIKVDNAWVGKEKKIVLE